MESFSGRFSTTKKSDGNALLSNILMTHGCRGYIKQDDILNPICQLGFVQRETKHN
jgi:hypothetical protein